MNTYCFNFFFPTQPGARQEHNERVDANNPATAFGRAWRSMKRNPKFKGRRLGNFRVGVIVIPGAKHGAGEAGGMSTEG